MKFWDVVMKMNRFWWRLCDLVSLDTLQHTQSAGLMHLYSFSFVGYWTRSTNRKTLSYCKYKNNTRTNTRSQFSTNHKCKTRDVKALHFTFVEVNFLFLLSQHCVYSLVRFRHNEKKHCVGFGKHHVLAKNGCFGLCKHNWKCPEVSFKASHFVATNSWKSSP